MTKSDIGRWSLGGRSAHCSDGRGQVKRQLLCWSAACTVLPLTAAAEALEQARQNHLDDLATYYRNALRGEEVVELTAGGEAFLGLSLEQRTGTPQGGILLLHDQGHNPDWPFRLQQARSYLPDVGWSTLAIALPRTPRTT